MSCSQIQFRALQLGHKAHGANVDTQNRYAVARCSLGHMQNRAVTAKADHQLRILKLSVQLVKTQIPGQFITSVYFKGQAKSGFNTGILQNSHRRTDRLEILIPIGIRG